MSSNLKYIELSPNNQSATLAVGPSQQTREFLIPSSVYSLKDTLLRGTCVAEPNGNNAKLNVEKPPLADIKLILPNGLEVFTVKNLDIYMKHVRKACTPNQDFVKNGPVIGSALTNTNFMNCSQTPYVVTNTSAVSSNVFALQTGVTSAALGAADGAAGNLLQNRYLVADAGNLTWQFSLRLGDIPHSVFACDKNFALPAGCRLQVIFRQSPLCGCSAANSSLGTTNLVTLTYSNLNLQLAEEQNEARRSEAMSRAARGDTIPYVYEFSNSLGTQTNATNTTLIDSGMIGSNLLRVYTVVANNGNAAQWAVSEIVSNAGLTSLQNKIGNHYTRDQLTTMRTEAYDLMFSKLQNSAYQGARDYAISPVWCDEFSDAVDLTKCRWTDCDENSFGMGLAGPISWSSRVVKTATDMTAYYYFVGQRKLHINAGTLY